jgi:predicted HicB family RNase H-like nuclease
MRTYDTDTAPRDARPSHTESTLGNVQDHTEKPREPAQRHPRARRPLRKIYHVRLDIDVVTEAMEKSEPTEVSLAELVEQLLMAYVAKPY